MDINKIINEALDSVLEETKVVEETSTEVVEEQLEEGKIVELVKKTAGAAKDKIKNMMMTSKEAGTAASRQAFEKEGATAKVASGLGEKAEAENIKAGMSAINKAGAAAATGTVGGATVMAGKAALDSDNAAKAAAAATKAANAAGTNNDSTDLSGAAKHAAKAVKNYAMEHPGKVGAAAAAAIAAGLGAKALVGKLRKGKK